MRLVHIDDVVAAVDDGRSTSWVDLERRVIYGSTWTVVYLRRRYHGALSVAMMDGASGKSAALALRRFSDDVTVPRHESCGPLLRIAEVNTFGP